MNQKCKRIIIVVVIVLSIAIPVAMTWGIWHYGNVDIKHSYGVPELIYFSSQVFAMYATLFAVIVALFGKEIYHVFFHENLKVYLTNNGISENLGSSTHSPNPKAQSYDCKLTLQNCGSKEIVGCQILLKEVLFKKHNEKKYKPIVNFENKPLYWFDPDRLVFNLLANDSISIPLFKIYPENSCSTPDESTISPLRMSIMGCGLSDKYRHDGMWKTIYQVRAQDKIFCELELNFSWDGEWCDRYSEMVDKVEVKLKNR